jgi:hypothetical protein
MRSIRIAPGFNFYRLYFLLRWNPIYSLNGAKRLQRIEIREGTMKRANVSWVIIVACLLTASCDQVFDRERGTFNFPGSARSLEGTWYVGGDRDKRAQIVSASGGLEARNERGQSSRLDISGGRVRALDWEKGLQGTVRRDQIEWENGTTWTREARR